MDKSHFKDYIMQIILTPKSLFHLSTYFTSCFLFALKRLLPSDKKPLLCDKKPLLCDKKPLFFRRSMIVRVSLFYSEDSLGQMFSQILEHWLATCVKLEENATSRSVCGWSRWSGWSGSLDRLARLFLYYACAWRIREVRRCVERFSEWFLLTFRRSAIAF